VHQYFISTTFVDMKKLIFTFFFCAILSFIGKAQVNWATDIAPILYENCVQCHRSQGIGNFSLIGYNAAFSSRLAIANAVTNKVMPPWKADPSYRHFTAENVLTTEEIQKINDWVSGNAPSGDMSTAPPDPVFMIGSSVGMPDMTFQTPFHTINTAYDEYRCFVIPSGLLQKAYLRGMEVIPGNHAAVHHVLVYQDVTGQAAAKDAQTPEPGYVSFGGIGVANARLIGAWVPGAAVKLFPEGMGVKIDAGADIVVQIHFPPNAVGLGVQSQLNLFFTESNTGVREISLAPILNHSNISLVGGPLNIPPNTVKDYEAQFLAPGNFSLFTVAPHMHLIGKSMKVMNITAQGDTIPLINIPDWDFQWQGSYTFQKVQKISTLSRLKAFATYDNTVNNPHNPSNPPQVVVQGESTTDEMLLVYFAYMNYQAGDENIILDSTLLQQPTNTLDVLREDNRLTIYPNPTVTDDLYLTYEVPTHRSIKGYLTNMEGKTILVFSDIENQAAGIYNKTLSVASLPQGYYVVHFSDSNGTISSKKFVKAR
jgi:hypothetical protein